jgi:DinB family protein
MAGRDGIEALLYLLDEAFRGGGIEETDESQALLTNLASVRGEWWRALPAGATRTIESIALHVGSCKVMYDDYAFGAGTLDWGTTEVEPWREGEAPPDDVRSWLQVAHSRLIDHVEALGDDSELDRPRLTNWGALRATRWIVAAMITHDAYHAGEINHVRSLLDGDDRWRYVQQGFG